MGCRWASSRLRQEGPHLLTSSFSLEDPTAVPGSFCCDTGTHFAVAVCQHIVWASKWLFEGSLDHYPQLNILERQ